MKNSFKLFGIFVLVIAMILTITVTAKSTPSGLTASLVPFKQQKVTLTSDKFTIVKYVPKNEKSVITKVPKENNPVRNDDSVVINNNKFSNPTLNIHPHPISGNPMTITVAVSNGLPSPGGWANINGWVNMYEIVQISRGNYRGVLVDTKRSIGNVGAAFTIQPGQIVNFVGFSEQAKATSVTSWTFDTPPYRNFGYSPVVGFPNAICQINYDNPNEMLLNYLNGYACATSMSSINGDYVRTNWNVNTNHLN